MTKRHRTIIHERRVCSVDWERGEVTGYTASDVLHTLSPVNQHQYLQMGYITAPNAEEKANYYIYSYIMGRRLQTKRTPVRYCNTPMRIVRSELMKGLAAYERELEHRRLQHQERNGFVNLESMVLRRYATDPDHSLLTLDAWREKVDRDFYELRHYYYRAKARSMLIHGMPRSYQLCMIRAASSALEWGDATNPRWNTITRYDWLRFARPLIEKMKVK